MRARRWVGLAVAMWATRASAEPKPKPVDIKSFRDKAIVLQDTDGGTYVAVTGEDRHLFYGVAKKPLYAQWLIGASSDGSTGAWSLDAWAPRVAKIQPGSVIHRADGSFIRYCGDNAITPLTQVNSDKAKTILDKSQFMSSALTRRPKLLARDDSGVYYYVDMLSPEYGGNGYRVFIGKKGAMKQKPLTDIAKDSAGEIFATKTGDLRIVHAHDTANSERATVTWVKGGKREALVSLDVDANSTVIFKDLGVYGFTGSLCEND
ncbi:MAG TPA: hypothetical protein VLB44_20455 [Kofleriaceae bacterium]|nr:hypothetical protein [Kofleriaceae bacterium]